MRSEKSTVSNLVTARFVRWRPSPNMGGARLCPGELRGAAIAGNNRYGAVRKMRLSVSGSFSASAPLSGAGASVMQMVAFQAAGSGSSLPPTPTPAPTPTPTSTPSPTPAPTPAPTPSPTPNPDITLAWNANQATGNSATNTAGYRVHMGSASVVYTQTTDVGNATTCAVSDLMSGTTYYFVVTAYDSAGLDSPPSNDVSQAAP